MVTIECLVWKDDSSTVDLLVKWERYNVTINNIEGNTSSQSDLSNVFERHYLNLFVLSEEDAGSYTCVDSVKDKRSRIIDIDFFLDPPTLYHVVNYEGKVVVDCTMNANDTNLLPEGGFKLHFKSVDEMYLNDVTDTKFNLISSTKDTGKFKAISSDPSFNGIYRCEKIGYWFGRDTEITIPRQIKGKYLSNFGGNFEKLLEWYRSERIDVEDRIYILQHWTSNRVRRNANQVMIFL